MTLSMDQGCNVDSLLKLGFPFNFWLSSLDILYHGILKNGFFVLDLDDIYNNLSLALVSNFDWDSESVK